VRISLSYKEKAQSRDFWEIYIQKKPAINDRRQKLYNPILDTISIELPDFFGKPILATTKQYALSPVMLSDKAYSFYIPLDVILNGGGEGSRTPVRKPIHITFSGCSGLQNLPDGVKSRNADVRQPLCA